MGVVRIGQRQRDKQTRLAKERFYDINAEDGCKVYQQDAGLFSKELD